MLDLFAHVSIVLCYMSMNVVYYCNIRWYEY